MNTNTERLFLDLLEIHGHNGDRMCLATISEKLSKYGLVETVAHYEKYLNEVKVVNMSAKEIYDFVSKGGRVWSLEGFIEQKSSKLKLPCLNNSKMLLIADIQKIVGSSPVVVF